MNYVGVRELKNDASEVIRAVREDHAEYVVTYRGRPVAVIRPVDASLDGLDVERSNRRKPLDPAFWERWDLLAARIGASIRTDMTAAEMVAEQRRVL
ncbi:MAG: type II toxin-antitoxin system Phd/YefM family antitoxin [Ardenticatenales bacterium]|jgi:prevent-host-death family protein|nr:type II toxin-antitoxin system Phd/YefM family antitoxin [Ardenticatenales bacterium]